MTTEPGGGPATERMRSDRLNLGAGYAVEVCYTEPRGRAWEAWPFFAEAEAMAGELKQLCGHTACEGWHTREGLSQFWCGCGDLLAAITDVGFDTPAPPRGTPT